MPAGDDLCLWRGRSEKRGDNHLFMANQRKSGRRFSGRQIRARRLESTGGFKWIESSGLRRKVGCCKSGKDDFKSLELSTF